MKANSSTSVGRSTARAASSHRLPVRRSRAIARAAPRPSDRASGAAGRRGTCPGRPPRRRGRCPKLGRMLVPQKLDRGRAMLMQRRDSRPDCNDIGRRGQEGAGTLQARQSFRSWSAAQHHRWERRRQHAGPGAGQGTAMPLDWMPETEAMRPRDILANNLRALMAARPDLGTLPKVTAACGVSNGTLDRIRRAAVSTGIDELERWAVPWRAALGVAAPAGPAHAVAAGTAAGRTTGSYGARPAGPHRGVRCGYGSDRALTTKPGSPPAPEPARASSAGLFGRQKSAADSAGQAAALAMPPYTAICSGVTMTATGSARHSGAT